MPFMLIASDDTPSNQVDLTYGPGMRTLNICMKKKMKHMDDISALMTLEFYKAPMYWLQEILP